MGPGRRDAGVAAVVAAFGFTAIGLSRIDDPISRRRALFWFSMGHVVFGVVFLAVSGAMFDQFIPYAFRWTPLTIGIALVYVAVTCAHAPRLPRPFRGLPDNTPGPILIDRARPGTTVDALRSQYEQQIRQAARLEERARLARDLHDAVKQQLFAIQTSAATAQACFSSDAAGAHTALEQVRASARDAMKEMEAMIVSFTFGDDWERPWNAIVAVIAAITVARYAAAWHRVRERGEVLV